jgi:hypothetical protein
MARIMEITGSLERSSMEKAYMRLCSRIEAKMEADGDFLKINE